MRGLELGLGLGCMGRLSEGFPSSLGFLRRREERRIERERERAEGSIGTNCIALFAWWAFLFACVVVACGVFCRALCGCSFRS